jgi:hypothetical protein
MDSLIGVIPDDWAERRLDELCDLLAGPSSAQISLMDRESAEVPVVTPRDLRHNRVADDWAAGVTDTTARGLSRYRLLPGDIVCARTGHIGRQALVTAKQHDWLIDSACLRLRVRQMISAPYLVYYFGHPAVHDWIIRNVRGAVIPSLSTKMLGALPVVVPPDDVQARVAETLSALDDKIIIHQQISRTTADLRDAVLLRLLPGARA